MRNYVFISSWFFTRIERMALLQPKASAKFIAESAEFINIMPEGIEKVAEKIAQSVENKEFSISTWKSHPVNPKVADREAIDWIFLVDTLNFSFWTETGQPKYEIEHEGTIHTGYWALCAAVNRAKQEGIEICKAKYYATVSRKDLEHIFRSNSEVEMPLLNERLIILNETGTTLQEKFGGSFVTCIEEAKGSAKKLLDIIIGNFPSYRDEANYAGQRVSFYKRAQILVADIWACYEGVELGKFDDIDEITMFADYRVPQVLVHLGAMEYNATLTKELKAGKLFENGSKEEVEIRGCTIWTVEKLCEALRKKNHELNAILVDYYLWDLRRLKTEEFESTPFHKTRCIYY